VPEDLSPAQYSLRARLAAHRLHATHDGRELTKKARAAFEQRFYDEVDPERELPEDERRRRAEHAMKAHMLALSRKSAKARKARR
jgi:hypothetical protein